jgi:hypothetical protein
MKNVAYNALTMLFVCVILSNTILPVEAAVKTSPVSCWSFDEVDGDAMDAMGTNTLVNQNSMPYATGIVGGAANIDNHNSVASAQYLSIDNNAQQGLQMTDAMSVSVWINYDESMDNKYSMIFSKFDVAVDYSAFDISYALALNGGSKNLQFWASRDGDSGSDSQLNTAPAALWAFNPTPGVWYHIVVTYHAGDVHLYVDNKELQVLSNHTDTSIHQSEAQFAVGYATVIREAHEQVDELGIWNRVLSRGEVKKLWNKGNGVSCRDL